MNHGGNPVLRWNAGNTVAKIQEGGLIKPEKAGGPSSRNKIDGIVATIFALERARVHGMVGEQKSV